MIKFMLVSSVLIYVSALTSSLSKSSAQEGMRDLTHDQLNKAPSLSHEERSGFGQFEMRLSKAKYRVGEVIWGKLTVTNLWEDRQLVTSPPWHGFFVSTLDVVARKERKRQSIEGDELSEKWNPPEGVIWHMKGWERYNGARVWCHNEIVIGPGETFVAWVPVNVLQNNNSVGEFGWSLDSNWLPGYALNKPGKYQIFITYWDSPVREWPDSSNLDDYLTVEGIAKLKQQRLEKAKHILYGRGVRSPVTLGPFEVEISALPEKNGVKENQIVALESMVARWNSDTAYREPITDFVRGFKEEDIAELPEILQGKMLGTDIGNSLSFTAIRHHLSIEREEGKPARFVPLKLEDIDRLLERMMHDDPLWTHVVLAKCIWLHEHDQRAEAIKLADSIRATNPDAEVFWHLAQYGKWTEKDRDRPQKPN